MLSLILAIAVSAFVLTALKITKRFWLFNTNAIEVNKTKHLNVYRIFIFLRFTFFFLALALPQYIFKTKLIDVSDLIVYCFIAPFTLTLMISPDLKFSSMDRLIFNVALNGVVTIHLKNIYQPYDKKTYSELLCTFKALSVLAKVAQMSSPMFYHSNGELRNLDFFTRWAEKNHFELKHFQDTSFNILPKIKMKWLSSESGKEDGLKRIHLNLWHKFILRF